MEKSERKTSEFSSEINRDNKEIFTTHTLIFCHLLSIVKMSGSLMEVEN